MKNEPVQREKEREHEGRGGYKSGQNNLKNIGQKETGSIKHKTRALDGGSQSKSNLRGKAFRRSRVCTFLGRGRREPSLKRMYSM